MKIRQLLDLRSVLEAYAAELAARTAATTISRRSVNASKKGRRASANNDLVAGRGDAPRVPHRRSSGRRATSTWKPL